MATTSEEVDLAILASLFFLLTLVICVFIIDRLENLGDC